MEIKTINEFLARKEIVVKKLQEIYYNCEIAQKIKADNNGVLPMQKLIGGKAHIGCVLFLTQKEYEENIHLFSEYNFLSLELTKI
jgi:hypothetical protein